MGSTNIDSYGLSQTFLNNDLVHGLKWDANYDGKKLNVGVAENTKGENDAYFIELDNDDIMDILSVPASGKPLDQRISALAGHTHKKSRKHKKSSKHKKTHHKRKHHKSHHKHHKSHRKHHKKRHHKSHRKHHKKRHHSHKRKHKAPIDRVIY